MNKLLSGVNVRSAENATEKKISRRKTQDKKSNNELCIKSVYTVISMYTVALKFFNMKAGK